MKEIIFGGIKYKLTQEAYIDDHNGMTIYTANAIDGDGKPYEIIWFPFDNYEELDDASNHCDWDNPDEVIKLF